MNSVHNGGVFGVALLAFACDGALLRHLFVGSEMICWFTASSPPPPSISSFQDAGIWFVFHSSSTGDSHGLVPETKAELTPLGIFYNNRVHSNFKVRAPHPAVGPRVSP